MGAVVAHHPDTPGRDGDRPELAAQARVYRRVGHHGGRIQVWLLQWPAVDRQAGVGPALNRLSADRDDTLDQVVLVGGTKPMNDNAFCTQRTATLCERIDL